VNYALKAGEVLIKIKALCRREKRNLQDFLKEYYIRWSRSYYSFLISLFKFVHDYLNFKNVTISINFMSKNFNLIKKYIKDNIEERKFWMFWNSNKNTCCLMHKTISRLY